MSARQRMKAKLTAMTVVALLLFGWSVAQDGDAAAEGDVGERLYGTYCAVCHQPDGSGVEDQYPALDGSAVVTGSPQGLLTFPLQGPGEMPRFAQTLDNEELATVASYVRGAWGNDADPVNAETVAELREQLGAPEPIPDEIDFAWQDLGEQVYANNCAACHQADGTGLEGAYPGFVGNGFVLADPDPVIRLPLNGRGGMPSFRNDLSNEEIAAALSYIRNTWGNQAAPVSPDMVADVRGDDDEPEEPGGRPGAAD